MKLKIGIIGSGTPRLPEKVKRLAFRTGKAIAEHNCILVNGACTGVPYESSKGAKKADGFVVGISPAKDMDEHLKHYKFPQDKFDVLIFSGFGFKGRNVLNVSSADCIIMICGSTGTLNEFSIAYDEGRVIGVLLGSGGISDQVREIIRLCNKETGATMIYEKDPYILVKKVILATRKRGNNFARRTD
ncbi:hypothetical protein JXB11_00135 [Candidatus Woesearchaeota archaeon]|nr:hypothetical protein [Candidatus Woesearchaeota archaeon]